MKTPPIFNFFKKIDQSYVPTSPLHEVANKAVEKELQLLVTPESSTTKGNKIKYREYSAESRAKIAIYAIENGNTAAARYFSKEFGSPVNESTVRGITQSYEKMKKMSSSLNQQIMSLPKSPRGRPLKLGDLDSKVRDYLRNLRLTGGIVNSRVVLAAAKGVVMAKC
ncbi:hypothetical protein KUTeg_022209 [Tegillarca granosa]|uniref:Uncharacterized protein n=1 Tax=Tegillarca granosa TaxID=220873 RepID=A0ABQ9EB42_TEGGR|nr:hypothetical protein KUTeg_022209 [Tegillarca granosa]